MDKKRFLDLLIESYHREDVRTIELDRLSTALGQLLALLLAAQFYMASTYETSAYIDKLSIPFYVFVGLAGLASVFALCFLLGAYGMKISIRKRLTHKTLPYENFSEILERCQTRAEYEIKQKIGAGLSTQDTEEAKNEILRDTLHNLLLECLAMNPKTNSKRQENIFSAKIYLGFSTIFLLFEALLFIFAKSQVL